MRRAGVGLVYTRRIPFGAATYATNPAPAPSSPSPSFYHPPRSKDKLAEREVLLSVLNTTATKRDAKAYLARFNPTRPPGSPADAQPENQLKRGLDDTHADESRLYKTGVNLGGLYARAIEDSPVFTHQPLRKELKPGFVQAVHVAVVKLRAPQLLDDETLDGVGLTLSQLAKLGMTSAVVIDCDGEIPDDDATTLTTVWKNKVLHQCNRITNAIQRNHGKAVIITQALAVSDLKSDIPSVVPVRGELEVDQEDQLLIPVQRGVIPVIAPIAQERDTLVTRRVEADDVVLALTRQFAGLTQRAIDFQSTSKQADAATMKNAQHPTQLDRIIVLDSLGGIPAPGRAHKAHIFINLEQEYKGIREDLQQVAQQNIVTAKDEQTSKLSVLGGSNPLSTFVESESAPLLHSQSTTSVSSSDVDPTMTRHLQNLDLIQRALVLLPRESSALLTTPEEAASSAHAGRSGGSATEVRTRRQKNPLIYNLLTDKPTISSSLPLDRLKKAHESPDASSSVSERQQKFTTFFKKGMPLTIIPDPLTDPWTPPGPEGTTLCLEKDPRIDLPRLVHLIEDSFGRPLDVQHYLDRIRNRIAGIIIAGEYEGGAILTWEDPPPRLTDDSTAQQRRPPVPYLDKFAVLRASQGAGGVADIVFKAMVRTCFPEGVVWRSRQNNPVNKWYFERSKGTWRLADGQWTMFWTGKGIEAAPSIDGSDPAHALMRPGSDAERTERWRDYVGVCSSIEASWADRDKRPPD